LDGIVTAGIGLGRRQLAVVLAGWALGPGIGGTQRQDATFLQRLP
jgi:hypothetical protein